MHRIIHPEQLTHTAGGCFFRGGAAKEPDQLLVVICENGD